EVRRPPLVGMQFLHEHAMGTSDFLRTRPRLKAKDLIGLLFRHFAGTERTALPRVRIALRVFTPAGIAAVKIRHQYLAALLVEFGEQAQDRGRVEGLERRAGALARGDAAAHRASVV